MMKILEALYRIYQLTSTLNPARFYKLCMYTDYTEIQIPIPNKYFGCGYKDLFFAESNNKRAENWMLSFDKSKESAVFSIILQQSLVFFSTTT